MTKMRVNIKWQPKNVEAKLLQHKEIVQEGLQQGLTDVRDVVVGEAQKNVSKRATDRGTLGQSLYPGHSDTYTETKKNKAIVGSKLVYAAAQEYGTKPFFPPSKPLVNWALRKGMTASVGYAVQQHIGKYGIEEKKYLRDGLDSGMSQAPRIMEKAAEDILERLGLK